jgi:DNA repair protein RecN (Recombination protein N)
MSAILSIEKYFKKSVELKERIQSTKIELNDITSEIEKSLQDIEFDPQRSEFLTQRLNLIYSLQKKHNVNSILELLEIRNSLQEKLSEISNFDIKIEETEKELELLKQELTKVADHLSNKRKSATPNLIQRIEDLIQKLGMPSGKIIINIEKTDNFQNLGSDNISLLFSANKNIAPQEISKIASGGEISRLMLAIKSIIAESVALPTIIFDEIDTGISGEIADKTANIMLNMSEKMQVLDITHLPQVAAKADFHYLVYKQEEGNDTNTKIRLLSKTERTSEIAGMLSGEKITDASLKNAQELLNAK